MFSRSCLVGMLLLGWAAPSWASDQLTTPRSMGMGDALRANATGSVGIHLNPSGLVLQRHYSAELAFQFRGGESIKDIDISIADSVTSRLAAGLFFNYLNADAGSTGVERTGWEAGVALAAPFGDSLSIGVTPKYQSVGRAPRMGGPPTGGKADGFTIDAGATLRVLDLFSLGVVGANLVEQDSVEAPRNLGLGVGVELASLLVLGFDTVLDFDTSRLIGKPDQLSARYHVGGELLVIGKLALRSGYIRDNAREVNFVAYGVSVVTSQIGLDFGGRTQVGGPSATSGDTLLGVALRLVLQ